MKKLKSSSGVTGMSKLLKFKSSVTFEEAAKHLTKMLGEEVTPSDVEQLARDGHLQVSVFAENWAAYYSKPLEHEDVRLTGRITRTDGHPDAVLFGVYPIDLFSAFRPSGFDGPGLYIEIKDDILARCYEIVDPETPPAINEKRIPLNSHRRPSTEVEHLVIRPQDLLDFAAKANDETSEKPINGSERATWERLVYVLAMDAKFSLEGKCYADEESIRKSAELKGVIGLAGNGNVSGKLLAAKNRIERDKNN